MVVAATPSPSSVRSPAAIQRVLVQLLGPPAAESEGVQFWALAGASGDPEVQLPDWTLPEEYVATDGTVMPTPAAVGSRGWRPLPRTVPPQLPPPEIVSPEEDEESLRARERELPPMLRRKRARDRDKQ